MLELLKMLTVQELVGHKGIYYRFWNYSTWIEHFTLEAQQRILEWILEKI